MICIYVYIREFIPLFNYLGVKDEVFFNLQAETFNRINDLSSYFTKKGAVLPSPRPSLILLYTLS